MSDEKSRDDLLLANRALLVLHSTRTAAHELNNVFQMIGGSAELLVANPALAPALVPRLDTVVRHVRRGEAIVRAVADLARPEGPGPTVLDLAEIVNHTLDMRRFEHRRGGVAVTTELEAGVLARADARDLVQVLLNAVLCAERDVAGRPDAAITVTLARRGDTADVTVADNGESVHGEPFDLTAATLLAASAGGSLERVGHRSQLRLKVAGPPSAPSPGMA
jgi:nitrogen fixation/metabolism regulation signal transduction histidine kinase